MADEIKQTLPQKLCAEYSCECVVVYIFYGFCFLFKRNENRVYGGRLWGWWWKKKNSDTSSHIVHTFVTRSTFINYNWRFIYQSCQSQEPLDFFFTHSSRLFKVYIDFYIYIIIIIYKYIYIYVRSRIQQQWTLSKVIFAGGFARCILLVSRKTFNMPSETTSAEHETA